MVWYERKGYRFMSGLVPNPSAWESDNEGFVLVTWLARESVTTLAQLRTYMYVQVQYDLRTRTRSYRSTSLTMDSRLR